MNKRERALIFSRYVSFELKGAITSRGRTASEVSVAIHRSPSNMNRWLNGKVDLPMVVLCEAAEEIGVDPEAIVEAAYRRLCDEFGDRSSITQITDAAYRNDSDNVVRGRFGTDVRTPAEDDLDAVARPTDPEPTDEQ